MEEEEWQPEEKKQKKDNCIIHCSENGGKIVDVKYKYNRKRFAMLQRLLDRSSCWTLSHNH